MKRLGALLLAVGMVFGAVLVRDRIDDGDATAEGEPLRLRCAAELRAVCDELAEDRDIEVDVAAPGTTADELVDAEAGGDPGFDLWLTTSSWPAIVEDSRRLTGSGGAVIGEPSEVLARSPVVLGVRAESLGEHCGDAADWTCIGDAARDGTSVGLPSPDRGDGLAVLASLVAGRLGTAEFAINDVDDDPGFEPWFRAITSSSHDQNLGDLTPLRAGVAASGRFAAVGALEADVAELPRSREMYRPIYPEPVVTADVVLVPSPATDPGDGIDRLGGAEVVGDALAAAGWRVQGESLPEGADADLRLPDDAETPAPGVLQALRDRWRD